MPRHDCLNRPTCQVCRQRVPQRRARGSLAEVELPLADDHGLAADAPQDAQAGHDVGGPGGQLTLQVALVPLGTPLLAGPGAIVATMLFVRQSHHVMDYVAVALAIALVLLIVWVMLRFSGVVVRLLRPAGIEVVSRISGLLLAAIAVQMIAGAVGAMVTAYLHSPH